MEYKINKQLKELAITINDLIDAYLEQGKISWGELIGMLDMIKMGLFLSSIEEQDAEGFDDET